MRKILLFVVLFTITGCSMLKINERLKHKSKNHYSIKENKIVLYDGKPYAELQAITWSLDGGELVKEFNFKLLDNQDLSIIGGMIDYISNRHNGDEVEIEFNIEPNSEQFKL